ncbi:hypothetical protein [Dactylosporangium sp. NPDC000521]|uniref:hypothetical protein n=1 Tax=Dactylosporangium sp. NPDC000521 TaxID=3363975 RepID=UPI0036A1A0DA
MTVRWPGATAGEVAAAVEGFARRIAVFDPPPGDGGGGVEVTAGDAVVRLSPGVARAFVEALVSYQDPRDRGSCDHCGGARLDDNFVCADCGQPSGLFGQLLRERAARFEGPAGEVGPA